MALSTLLIAFAYILGAFAWAFITEAAYESTGEEMPQWVEFTPLVWPLMVVSVVASVGGLLGRKFEQRRRRRG